MAKSIDMDVSHATTNGHGPATSSASSTSAAHAQAAADASGNNAAHAPRRVDAVDYAEGAMFKPLWEGSDVDRREFVRLTLQALEEIGYGSTVAMLKEESGFTLESSDVTEFRNGILAGQWDAVEALLHNLPPEQISDITVVKFAIRQQKFLEALEANETKKALSILRNELATLNYDSARLHVLSSWIMCNSPEDLRSRASWDGVAGHSRELLLIALQKYISPSLMIPRRRLATLIEQAKTLQRQNCLFHSVDNTISLLTDCNCDPSSFPSVTTHVLDGHTDEIWRLEFSHNGEWLATAGRDKKAILWKVKDGFAIDKVLEDHADPVSCLAWSPDDTILLTAAEQRIKMWNTATGVCINTLEQHSYPIGALSWMPDGRSFVSGGMDSKILAWDLAGNKSSVFPTAQSPSRVIDLAVTPDGKRLIAVGRADSGHASSSSGSASNSRGGTPAQTPIQPKHVKRISVFNLVDKTLEYEITQPCELTSVSISPDSRFALISHAPSEILYLDLREQTILQRYQGHDQGQDVIQSCFGGALQNYVLSGSKDGRVFIWHRDSGVVVRVLTGHGDGSVNAVAWNHAHRGMFASASDDRTIRIWEMTRSSDKRAVGAGAAP